MNETFWTPAETDLYLQSEYGSEPSSLPLPDADPHRGCSDKPVAPYDSYFSDLPGGIEVMKRQHVVESKHAKRIAKAALYDRQLWRKRFPGDASLSEMAPWQFPQAPQTTRVQWPRPQLATAVLPSLSALLAALAAGVSIRTIWASSSSSGLLQLIWHQSFDGAALSLYVALILVLAFLQSLAAAKGSEALAAAVVFEAAELLRAAGTAWVGGRLSFWRSLRTCQPTRLGRVPVWMLTALPGVAGAVSCWISFVSLCWLDPATYVLLTQASLLLVEVAGRSWRSACGAALVACAFMLKASKALETADAALGRGLLCALFQVPLHAMAAAPFPKVDAPRELLSASRHAQGLLFLVGLMSGFTPGPYASSFDAMAEVFRSQWLLCAVGFLLATSAIKEVLLPRISPPMRDLGVGGLMLKASTLQWLLLSWGGDAKDLEALCLGLATVLVCAAEQMSASPVSVPASASAAENGKPPRCPRTEATGGRWRKPSAGASDGSTTAPSTPRGRLLTTTRLLPGGTSSKETSSRSSDGELSNDLASDSE